METNDTEINDNKIYSIENITWISVDTFLMAAILAGNMLTLSAIRISRKISVMVSNQFIFNLALSDLMVGLTLPYHLAFYIDINTFGSNKNSCILRFVLIILACSSSIINLLAIASDRYIAIVHPLSYNRYMTRKVAISIISSSWLVCFLIATVPIYWNDWIKYEKCNIEVLPQKYLNLLVTPMFGSVWVAMYIVYIRIWKEATGHVKRLRENTCRNSDSSMVGDSKSVQVVLLILGCFSICWLPYFIVVIYISITGEEHSLVYEAAFTMAATNSCMNPIIYAWKNSNFRQAFWRMLRCKRVNSLNQEQYITNHVPSSIKNSLANRNASITVASIIHKNDIEMFSLKP